ncbi:hypothetical protein [Microcoleus sp. F4-D5]|uniref:hypothetical protein n=1 Tax=Microcoleus sp. F4-D5 TaxID=2818760 RepID=UPI002FD0400C
MSVDRAFLPPLYATNVIHACQEPQTKLHNSWLHLQALSWSVKVRSSETGML